MLISMPMVVDVALDTHCLSGGLFAGIGVERGGDGEGSVCTEDCFFSFFVEDFFSTVALMACLWGSVFSRFFTPIAALVALDVVMMAALLVCFGFFVAFLVGNEDDEDLCFNSKDEFTFFNEAFLLTLIVFDERVFFFCTFSTFASSSS